MMRDRFVMLDDHLCAAPHGTITGYVDYDQGLLWLYCEPEPDPRDWAMAVEYMAKVGTDRPAREYDEDGILVFVKTLRLEAFLEMSPANDPHHDLDPYAHTVTCPPYCRHSSDPRPRLTALPVAALAVIAALSFQVSAPSIPAHVVRPVVHRTVISRRPVRRRE